MNKKKISLAILLVFVLALTVTGCEKKESKDEIKEEVSEETKDEVKEETEKETTELVSEETKKLLETEKGGTSMEGIFKLGEELNLDQLKKPVAGEEVVVMETNQGTIKLRLFDNVAPKAVENFKTHAKDGYYNGVSFHRVIKDFMIQGGDPDGTGMGGESIWGEAFEDEFDINYRNFRGALSMANAGENTNGSQFFIVQLDKVDENIISQMRDAGEEQGYPENIVEAYANIGGTFHLDGKHTVFGQVYEGMDIVDKIANLETGQGDRPVNDVIMEKVYIEEVK